MMTSPELHRPRLPLPDPLPDLLPDPLPGPLPVYQSGRTGSPASHRPQSRLTSPDWYAEPAYGVPIGAGGTTSASAIPNPPHGPRLVRRQADLADRLDRAVRQGRAS